MCATGAWPAAVEPAAKRLAGQRPSARSRAMRCEIARRGPGQGGWVGSEGAKVFSAVDGKLEAREPDL